MKKNASDILHSYDPKHRHTQIIISGKGVAGAEMYGHGHYLQTAVQVTVQRNGKRKRYFFGQK
jgi:hypothetical protein